MLPFPSVSIMDFFLQGDVYIKVIDVKYRKSGLKIYNVWNKE